MDLKKKYNFKTISYSKSLENSIRKINKNKDLKNIIQEINIINSNVLRYNQIEKLLKSDKEEKDKYLINLQKRFKKENKLKKLEKTKTYEDMVERNNKANSQKAINIDKSLKERKIINFKNIPYKYNGKEGLNDYFKKINNNEGNRKVRLFPLFHKSNDIKNKLIKINLNESKELLNDSNNSNNHNNSSEKEKIINDYNNSYNKKKQYQKNYYLPRTLETDKRINIGFDKYASNNVIFNNPQIYLLNNRNSSLRQKLPYINNMKKTNIKSVDLFKKNNNSFNSLSKGNNNNDEKYTDFYLKLRKKDIIKFKIE
jgi:hypothetical protein